MSTYEVTLTSRRVVTVEADDHRQVRELVELRPGEQLLMVRRVLAAA